MSAPDMTGRVCLVTGATSGIGRVTATELARLGATTMVVGRDPKKAEDTVAAIRAATGNSAVSHLLADLSSQAAIRALAAELGRRHDRLHVLVNNAGAIFTTRSLTVDGLETTFATNHLAYFLLTHLLRDLLVASAPARIVNVASTTHSQGRIDFDDLQGERRYGAFRAYNQSKLANVLFTHELARRLAGTGVTANCLHPGVVASGFGKNNRLLGSLIKLAGVFFLSSEKGARTTLHLATSPDVEGATGQYFARSRPTRSSRASYDEAVARRLWEVSARLTGVG